MSLDVTTGEPVELNHLGPVIVTPTGTLRRVRFCCARNLKNFTGLVVVVVWLSSVISSLHERSLSWRSGRLNDCVQLTNLIISASYHHHIALKVTNWDTLSENERKVQLHAHSSFR